MIQPRTKRSFLAAFTTVFSCVWRRPGIRQQPLVSDSSVRPPGAAHTLCVLRKSYLLREKTADQVVSGLKLKLKTSPTKVRLVSLKKSWKQAGRSHERRDVDFAESADFAEFDLRNRTQLNGHSNTYKRGFPLACSMPNFNDVRLKEMPKKRCQKSKKIVITLRRAGKVWKVPNSSASLVSDPRPKFPSVRGKDLVAKGCYGPWRILLNVNPPSFPVCFSA